MSNDQPSRRPPAKSSGGGAPMGSTISIVIAVVAVVIGFLILRNINDSDAGGTSDGGTPTTDSPTDETGVGTETTTPQVTTPPTPTTTLTFAGASVVVANASGVPGAAGAMSTSLAQVGWTLVDATNASGTEAKIDVTKVYYVDDGTGAALGVATSVAQALGNVAVSVLPTPPPIEGADQGLNGATVVVMLGKDLGGKPLPALAPTTTPTTLPGAPIDAGTTTTVAG